MANFLYKDLDTLSKYGSLNNHRALPVGLIANLNPKFEIRPYQTEAFSRYFYYTKDFPDRVAPTHLLFNMATGSGKTLVMAGLILHLYAQGYRNFLFFVNSGNIISKTKDNFLNSNSSKYLFNEKIQFENQTIEINEVKNFSESKADCINICLSTIQQLHSDLVNEKENSLTIDDFKETKIALLADEAHHINSKTKNRTNEFQGLEKPSWENTVEQVFKANSQNVLLEFTATLDFLDKNITEKYKSKIIYRYDLIEFRRDGFSKDVNILQSDSDKPDRMLQAVVLNQYRQDVASKHKINLKPVILFKAQKTINESEQNKEEFHNLIENLSLEKLNKFKENTEIDLIQKALNFYSDLNLLLKKLKLNFSPEHVLTTNETGTDEKNNKNESQIQKLLNTLEDQNNQIRAIFTVQKLNEGWDVLNLYDIVRLYTARDGDTDKNGDYKAGKTTISEAQLIGRGARYYPFNFNEGDKFKRKFDEDLNNEMRILEELHYHSFNEPRYISEIRSTLVKQGLLDEKTFTKELKLKEEFKQSDFFKNGFILTNSRLPIENEDLVDFKKLSVKQKNLVFGVSSGYGKTTQVFNEKDSLNLNITKVNRDIAIKNLGFNIIKKALFKDNFFTFENLKKYLPELKSLNDFVTKEKYLGNLEIRFEGPKNMIDNIPRQKSLAAINELLNIVSEEMKNNIRRYKGSTEFEPSRIKNVFLNKVLKFTENKNGDEDYLKDKEWFAFESNYGTSEEIEMIRMIEIQISKFQEKYDNIYLIRNERHFKIHRFSNGQAFEPDFVLFMKSKTKVDQITYQIFLEPKGKHIENSENDQNKLAFLKELYNQFKDKIDVFGTTKKHKIIGMPMFYNQENANDFKEKMFENLDLYQS